MSTDDILLGLGLVFVLAVSSQVLAHRLGLPAIVVLLPAGFVAGIATDDVHPDELLGSLYQPFVLYPRELPLPDEPLVGAASIHGLLVGWRQLLSGDRARHVSVAAAGE